ncbi:transcription elongation factor Spt5 [Candidatus Pacearchaeota archaeon]|nr:transcription elongation factor Spt5 [Candidatus Pacearchaeota archaeon]|tara:strand:+ start:1289 stop:1834 length:546 start_codon:yes stop_codon:yes gene_type:complete
MPIFIIKVTTNKEERALEMISDRSQKKSLNVFSIVKPHGLKGYIILEASDRDTAEEAAFNLPYVKGIIGKTVPYEEIKAMLEPKVEDFNIEIGDIVEMIGQTFKGEQAKVTRVDKAKGEVVVSLLGASVPIPVTVKMDNVKVIRRESEESPESNDEEDEKKETKAQSKARNEEEKILEELE